MKMNHNTVERINQILETSENLTARDAAENNITITNLIGGTAIVKDGSWSVCKLEDLSDTIKALQSLRNLLAEETGILF